ncbi:hypothetical protein [Tenacibaculum maritimum]|uniref:hypothetical protein n=1 Tax=Tenacibaculum maritimum TaxID=107401 RepID=UPI0012E46249|nr:hypothetical protein [Tenacibaculum maritimum]MDB0599787.1 hypothetical protein [Tenacibaculum maritimum]MDB0610898.1 hypothetical protein [Tenacibaculum maritimum]CAA0239076.1 conserved hypothetical protein [Tenacibaculum maritimum]
MADTKEQLEIKIKVALNSQSDINVNPQIARAKIAKDLAQAFSDFVKGRTTQVIGTSATGGAVTGTGIIQ